MVSNPEWAKSLAAFKLDLRGWIAQPTGDAFLKTGHSLRRQRRRRRRQPAWRLEGDAAGPGRRRRTRFAAISPSRRSLSRRPLGFFNRFIVEENAAGEKVLDIKKGGIFAIVHGVRSLALEYRVSETNTISRIQALSGRGPFGEDFTADLIEAFDFMAMLRLREQFAALDRGESYGNTINVDRLGSFERNLLRDSLKIVKHFKSDVAHHFRLQLLT